MVALKKIISDPMGSDDIIHYFPQAKITTYADLQPYKNIQQLLPAQEDFVFILYEESPREGHWVCLTRDIHNSINYFDVDHQTQHVSSIPAKLKKDQYN